jgi:hypothetical protein
MHCIVMYNFLPDYLDDDIFLFFFDVEVDYIIVVRHHAMSQQLFSSNHRQLGIALPMILASATYKGNMD